MSVGISAFFTLVLGIVVLISNGGNVYFTWGPSEDLHFISYTIDTWAKYIGVLIGIIPLAWMDVYTYDKIQPYFFSRIYLPEIPIKDWTKGEKGQLALWAVLSFATTNFRMIIDTLLTVTNFYFAIWRWILKEIIAAFIINGNLDEKFKRYAQDTEGLELREYKLKYRF